MLLPVNYVVAPSIANTLLTVKKRIHSMLRRLYIHGFVWSSFGRRRCTIGGELIELTSYTNDGLPGKR